MSDPNLFTVNILEKEYRVVCEKGEREELLRAARYLDEKMQEIRTNGKVIGAEKIAVMAALNITHEFLQQGNDYSGRRNEMEVRLRSLQEKIDIALNQNTQLEV